MTVRLPTLFIPHGGGPCFFMDPHDIWDGMAAYLRGIAGSLPTRPTALLIISGHWLGRRPTVNAGARPPMLFDYYNFPEHTYRLSYPAPGAPALATQVQALLGEASIATDRDTERGFDHGVFVPFLLVYPEADIPIVQLSLDHSLDAGRHLAIGRALESLRDQGVLIVGSGMSYHNLREFGSGSPRANAAAERFDTWLAEAATDSDPSSRDRRLGDWMSAPDALACHPVPEHLVPLFVAAGAGGRDTGRRTYGERIMGKAISGFQFG